MEERLVILLDPGTASNDYLRHEKSKEKRFAFDQAFDANTKNQQLFEATAQPLIGAAVQIILIYFNISLLSLLYCHYISYMIIS